MHCDFHVPSLQRNNKKLAELQTLAILLALIFMVIVVADTQCLKEFVQKLCQAILMLLSYAAVGLIEGLKLLLEALLFLFDIL